MVVDVAQLLLVLHVSSSATVLQNLQIDFILFLNFQQIYNHNDNGKLNNKNNDGNICHKSYCND